MISKSVEDLLKDMRLAADLRADATRELMDAVGRGLHGEVLDALAAKMEATQAVVAAVQEKLLEAVIIENGAPSAPTPLI